MAKQLFTNAYVKLNDVDLSDHVVSVTWDASTEIIDMTTMHATAINKEKMVSWDDWSFNVEFKQDFKAAAAGAVDATLWAIYLAHAAVDIIIKPNGATTAVTNPRFYGTAIMTNYSLGGSVGEGAAASATFEGSGVFTRDTDDA